MGEMVTIRGFKRQLGTRGQMKHLRRSGMIPAVCYGHGQDGISISLAEDEARKRLGRRRNGNTLVQLAIEGEAAPRLVLLKEIQRNPLDNRIMHVDFQAIELNESIKAEVPVLLHGEDEVGKKGLAISHQLREVEVECLPGYLPAAIAMEVGYLELGDKVLAHDLVMPEQVKLLTEPDAVILVVMPPGKAEEPPTAEAEAEA